MNTLSYHSRDNNEFIELRQVLAILMRRWHILFLGAVLGALLGYGISRQLAPTYRASITLIVGQSIQAPRLASSDIQIGEQLAATYAEIGQRQPVLQRTVEALELDSSWQALQERVRITPIAGTQLLEVAAEASSPAEARTIADELARQLILLSTSESNAGRGTGEVTLGQTGVNTGSGVVLGNETTQFLQERLVSLQIRIENGQQRIEDLEEAMASATNATEIRNLQNEIDALEGLISGWESNYVQLLGLVESERTPNFVDAIGTAQADLTPVRPQMALNTLLGGVIGLMLALGAVALREYTDDTLKTSGDLTHVLNLTPLGAVHRTRGRRPGGVSGQLITSLNLFSEAAESYRIIRSNILFVLQDRSPAHAERLGGGSPNELGMVMITSPTASEDKSLIAANLGIAMAQAGLDTIIVDADLRRPAQHGIFGQPAEDGLSDLLRARPLEGGLQDGGQGSGLGRYLKDTGIGSLRLLTSGNLPTPGSETGMGSNLSPSELLSTSYAEMLLNGLAGGPTEPKADIVILDSPPVLSTADAAVLSNQVKDVILVIEAGHTGRQQALEAIAILEQAGANLLGAILSRASHRNPSSRSYYRPPTREPRQSTGGNGNNGYRWSPGRGRRSPERVVTPPSSSGEGDDV